MQVGQGEPGRLRGLSAGVEREPWAERLPGRGVDDDRRRDDQNGRAGQTAGRRLLVGLPQRVGQLGQCADELTTDQHVPATATGDDPLVVDTDERSRRRERRGQRLPDRAGVAAVDREVRVVGGHARPRAALGDGRSRRHDRREKADRHRRDQRAPPPSSTHVVSVPEQDAAVRPVRRPPRQWLRRRRRVAHPRPPTTAPPRSPYG